MFSPLTKISDVFASKTLIDANHALWIEDTFAWCSELFDQTEFERCQLVQPSNDFFPGRVSSVEEKAQLILQQTQQHAGLAHWPCQLAPAGNANPFQAPVQLPVKQLQRDSSQEPATAKPLAINYGYSQATPSLPMLYLADQTLKPTDLAASYAHQLALHLIQQRQVIPPGGVELITEAAEVLAVFMGFGVLLVNSAHTFRGSCGSCYNAKANRSAQLSENQIIYALALFADRKQLSNKLVLGHVKKHLHSNYRTALRQLTQTSSNIV